MASLVSKSRMKPYGKGEAETSRDSTDTTASQHPSLLAHRADLEQTFLWPNQTNTISK